MSHPGDERLEAEMNCAGDSGTVISSPNAEDFHAEVGDTNNKDSRKDGCIHACLNNDAVHDCDITAKVISEEDMARTTTDDSTIDTNIYNNVTVGSDVITNSNTAADIDVNATNITTEVSNKDHNDAIRTSSDDIANNDSTVDTNICNNEGVTVGSEDNTAAGSDTDMTFNFESGADDTDESISSEDEVMLVECDVCMVEGDGTYLQTRPCCGVKICDFCRNAYVATAISRGVVHVQCPGNSCNVLIPDYIVLTWLSGDDNGVRAHKFLLEARNGVSAAAKTCPRCSHLHTLVAEELETGKEKEGEQKSWRHRLGEKSIERGKISDDDGSGKQRRMTTEWPKVTCEACSLIWCYPCHAPWHEGMSCASWLRAGRKQLKKWTQKTDRDGQVNAQRCPECKAYISRISGCNHMVCNQCTTQFCYDCGDRMATSRPRSSNKCRRAAHQVSRFFMGSHTSRLAPRGCTQNFLPHAKVVRRSVRGSIFVSKILAGVILSGPALAIGVSTAVVVMGVGVVAIPVYKVAKATRQLRDHSASKSAKKITSSDPVANSPSQSAVY